MYDTIPEREFEVSEDAPDLYEVGERDNYWIYVRRSTRKVELYSKHSGAVLASFGVGDAKEYGLTPMQIRCACDTLARLGMQEGL